MGTQKFLLTGLMQLIGSAMVFSGIFAVDFIIGKIILCSIGTAAAVTFFALTICDTIVYRTKD